METYTLRWEENGVSISLEFYMNDTFYLAYLGEEEMINIVNDLTQCRPSGPGQATATQPIQSDSNRVGEAYLKIEDAEKAYGKHVYQPSILPNGPTVQSRPPV